MTLRRYGRRVTALAVSVLLLFAAFQFLDPQVLVQRIGNFPWSAASAIAGLFAVNLLVVSFRLWRILLRFGVQLPFRAVFRASVAGQAASLFVISLFGQVVGRQAVLQRFGVSAALVASVTAYERGVLLVVGGAACAAGAAVLLGGQAVSDFVAQASLSDMAIAAAGGLFLSLCLGRAAFESRLAAKALSAPAVVGVLEVVAITLAAQSLVLAAYAIGALSLAPQVDPVNLVAAAAVVGFAASIPISVNGWGVREIGAVYMFGKLGVSAASAFAVSVAIGLTSMLVTLAAVPVTVWKSLPAPGGSAKPGAPASASLPTEVEKAAAWLIATAASVLVFFQLHVELTGGVINVNMADPFAVLALAAVAAHCWQARQPPAWHARSFNLALIAISGLLLVAFVHGVQHIGVTQWALTARLLGWLVLLGYLCAGYLMAANAGAHGRRRLFETMIATGATVVVLQVLLRWFLPTSTTFEGFAANRNAFAFQLLVCLGLLLAYSMLRARLGRPTQRWLWSMLTAIVLAGLLFTQSRAGLITGAALLTIAWAARLADRAMMVRGLLAALVLWQSPLLVHWLAVAGAWLASLLGYELAVSPPANIQGGGFSPALSNLDRWRSITGGLHLWFSHPFLGGGLGVFIANNWDSAGNPLVIHSTPAWILAELGLLGAGICAWAFFVVARYMLGKGFRTPGRRVLVMLLAAFALFALVHEIFYQRIFWLVLGASLAALPGLTTLRQASLSPRPRKLLFFVTEDWYFCSHRLPIAIAAKRAGYDVTVLTRVRKHAQVIRDAGFNLVNFEVSRRGINPVTEALTVIRLAAAYRRLSPDIVHHVAVKPILYGSIAARLTAVPCVVNALVGLGWTFTSRSRLARTVRCVVQRAMPLLLNRTTVIVQNPDNAAALRAFGVENRRIHLVKGSGVDTSVFRPAAQAEGTPVVVLAARMLWAKGVREFVDAAAIVRASGIQARFALVGEPDHSNPDSLSEQQLTRWQGQHGVEWWGHRADMPEVLRRARVVCLPTYYGEGIPMALLEAAATGLPIVTTDVDGCREVVQDGDNGFLIPARDPAALATAVIRLLGNSALAARMGARGRERALAEFDVRRVVLATLSLYEEAHREANPGVASEVPPGCAQN